MRFFTMIICLTIFTCTPVFAEKYPRVNERQIAMDLLASVENNPPRVQIDALKERSPEEQAFLVYFRDVIYPHVQKGEQLSSIYGILHVSVDRALYNNQAEKKKWIAQMQEARNELSRLSTDPQWKQQMRYWANLAVGLKGELPKGARKMVENDRLMGFSAEQMPLVQRMTELESEISLASNESSVTSEDLSDYQKQLKQIERDFRSGSLSFAKASQKINALWPKSYAAKGHDVATKAYDALNEMAVIRTQLAQSKGFNNWAEYVLASAKETHAPGLRSPEDHIRFMEGVLAKTLESAKKYRQWIRKKYPKLKIDNRNAYLLSPESGILVADYFPVESVNEFWQSTMAESGFDPEQFEVINLDSFPRKNKQSHAYMYPVVSPRPRVIRIKAGNLTVNVPPAQSNFWTAGQINIVQNAGDDGLNAYSTVFHEGGHGLDFAHRLSPFGMSESYAYTETASMTMERFFDDFEFLVAKGMTRKGKPLDPELARLYLRNSRFLSALGSRGQAFNALYDILIWSEAYTEDGPKFVDRCFDIFDEFKTKYFPGKTATPKGVRAGSSMFNTSHFYSGSVRYHGYIYADMAAQMTADFLWDHFEKTTGRRTFLHQPEMAEILINGSYRTGFKKPFPETTEKLTGKKLSPDQLADNINSAVEEALKFLDKDDCAKLISG